MGYAIMAHSDRGESHESIQLHYVEGSFDDAIRRAGQIQLFVEADIWVADGEGNRLDRCTHCSRPVNLNDASAVMAHHFHTPMILDGKVSPQPAAALYHLNCVRPNMVLTWRGGQDSWR